MDPTLGSDDLQGAIETVVGKFLEDLHLYRPPVDWVEIALGMPGLQKQDQTKATGLTRKKAAAKGTLLLSEDLADEQNQRLAAQAIAHTLMGKILGLMGGEPDSKAPSAWVKLVVKELMVPSAWFHALWREFDGDFTRVLKGFGPIPLEFPAQRMVEGPEPTVVAIIDHGSLIHRFSNGPRPGKTLLPLEKECLEYVNRFSRARRMSGGDLTVWGWPIHRSDWRKEVLRTVFVEVSSPDARDGIEKRDVQPDLD